MPMIPPSESMSDLLRHPSTQGKEVPDAHLSDAQEPLARGSLASGDDDGGGGPPPSFTAWLYRPYLDLSPSPKYGNPQTEGLLLALRAFIDEDDEIPRIHGLFQGTRAEVVEQARTPQFRAVDPRDVPRRYRTDEWRSLCWSLHFFDELDAPRQSRTLWLLHRLGLHRAILAREPRDSADSRYITALARLALALAGQGPLDLALAGMERAVGMPGSWTSVEATYHLAAVCGKVKRDLEATRRWAAWHEEAVDAFGGDAHTEAKLRSRYFRVAAFVPMLEGNDDEMVMVMDAAEDQAAAMLTDTIERTVEYQAVVSALYESRAKEAILVGDYDLAIERARRMVGVGPRFPLAYLSLGGALREARRWEEAAEAYRLAALYGPPQTEVAWFYRGDCLEQAGDLTGARDAYLSALAVDPLGDAAYERLATVAFDLGGQAERDLSEWASANVVPEEGDGRGE